MMLKSKFNHSVPGVSSIGPAEFDKVPFIYYVSKEGGWMGLAKCLLLLTWWLGGSRQMLT